MGILSGGPIFSTWLTVQGERMLGIDSLILAYDVYSKGDSNITTESYLLLIPSSVDKKFLYSNSYSKALSKSDVDLFHIQGLWLYLSHATASHARKYKIPYIVTLRGMLYPQALAASSVIKKLSLALYQRNDLQQAACIQATCVEEMNHYRALGFSNPVAIIPNPIDITKFVQKEIPPKPTFRIGYLGRIHSRKRIERLIYAINTLRHNIDEMELVIIGSGDKSYEKFLYDEAKRLKLSNVRFTGFLVGEEKDKAITELSVLVVPSDFENFGNIVSEALVRGVPVIASKGTPWKELESYNCGWWINNDQDTITQTILKAYNVGKDIRFNMGMNGKSLMCNNYSVDVLGAKMKSLYEWVLGQASKPDFVYED